MSVFICDKDTTKLLRPTFWTKIPPNLNISASISWSIYSEFLQPFKKLAVVYYRV